MVSRRHTKQSHERSFLIDGREVALKPLRKADGAAIVRMYRRPEVSRFLSMPITSLAVFAAYYKWVKRQRRAGLCASFTVRLKGQVVGLVQVRVTHPGVGELGWILDPSVWGSTVFQTAASSLREFAARRMGLMRLEARIALRNVRARRAMAKIGAHREARLHASLRLRERYLDEELWALSRDSRVRVRRTRSTNQVGAANRGVSSAKSFAHSSALAVPRSEISRAASRNPDHAASASAPSTLMRRASFARSVAFVKFEPSRTSRDVGATAAMTAVMSSWRAPVAQAISAGVG